MDELGNDNDGQSSDPHGNNLDEDKENQSHEGKKVFFCIMAL